MKIAWALYFVASFSYTALEIADKRHIGNRPWEAGCWCWSDDDTRRWPARSASDGVLCRTEDMPNKWLWPFMP